MQMKVPLDVQFGGPFTLPCDECTLPVKRERSKNKKSRTLCRVDDVKRLLFAFRAK